jgi:hypothetical protein
MQILKFFQKHRFKLLTVFILLLAVGLRFFKLGVIPHGMTWDEAAIGYNGYAVITTRRDEWLQKLPISFQSFGDYKAPFAIYLNGFFTYFLGMKLWVMRLPFAIFSVVAVWQMMLLTEKFVKLGLGVNKERAKWLALLSGLLIALSPWHLHFSRAGFESGMALTFVLISINSAFMFLQSKKGLRYWLGAAVSLLSAVLAVYTYHSSKIVVPLLFLSLGILFHKKWFEKGRWKGLLLGSLIAGGSAYPFIYDSLFGNGLERAGTLIFYQLEGLQKIISVFISQFAIHLSPQFLLLGEVTTLRHGVENWGVLLPTTFIVFLIGVFSVFADKLKTKKYHWFAVLWILIGLLPAALGTDGVPHQNRALLALPGFILLAVFGFEFALKKIKNCKLNKEIRGSHGEKNILVQSFIGSFMVFQIVFGVAYLNHYYTDFAVDSADAYQDGLLEALEYVSNREDEVDKIIFTSEYGQPYIYALFVRRTNPIWYRGGSLVKYEFTDKINMGDLDRNNTLVVTGQKVGAELPIEKAVHVVRGLGKEVRLVIFDTEEL